MNFGEICNFFENFVILLNCSSFLDFLIFFCFFRHWQCIVVLSLRTWEPKDMLRFPFSIFLLDNLLSFKESLTRGPFPFRCAAGHC